MSAALTAMITASCLSFSGNSHDACSKGMEASAKQSGVEQEVDVFQKDLEKKANRQAKDLLGDTGVQIVGGSIFVAKAVADKSININTPTFGLCDRITNQVGVDKYLLKLEWKF